MAQATAKQIDYIRSLLATRAHTDNGKTITVGQTRVRATAETIDQISTTTASKLIDALKSAEQVADEGPRFRRYDSRTWIITGLSSAEHGDIVDVPTRNGETKRVKINTIPGIVEEGYFFMDVDAYDPLDPATIAYEEDVELMREMRRQQKTDSSQPATESQVAYIMRLVDQGAHEEGGFISGGPTTIDEVRRMTRRDASMYIDSLTSNY